MTSTAQLPVESSEGFRVSPQQRRLWRLMERYPSTSFVLQCQVRITGPLNIDKLDKVILGVRRRYEILRTRFVLPPGTTAPIQIISQEVTGLDRRCEFKEQSAAGVKSIAETLWKQARSASGDPGVNFTLIHVADREHVLVVTSSGLCADGTALAGIVREVHAGYSCTSSHEGEALQYADISEWQNQLLESDAKEHDSYWKAPEFLALRFPRLPFERRNSKPEEFRSGALIRKIPANIIPLQQATFRSGDLGEAVLIATYQLLMSRLCSVDRFLMGLRVDGRTPAELRGAVGLFEKSLPVSAIVDQEQSFAELVQSVSRALELAAYDQAYFDAETFASGESSHLCHMPLVFGVRPGLRLHMVESTSWEIISFEECLDRFELAVTATVSDGLLETLKFSWDESIFHEQEVGLLADFYVDLLQQVVSDPRRTLCKFNLGPDAVSPFLTAKAIAETVPHGVHAWIEQQCARVPERVAAICEDRKITYAELDQRASLLALRLLKIGAAPDKIIAIIAQRSVDFIVAIFGVLKSGAAWLPIEPDTPPERINYMITQAGAIAVLIENSMKPFLQYLEVPAITLAEGLAQGPGADPPCASASPIFPEQLAYVIFTSGSTGRPKGVAIEHRQLEAYILGLKADMNLPDGASFALVSTMAADLGHTAVFAALTSGGCIHVIPSARSRDMVALGEYFLRNPVDYIKIVPAHLEALCASLPEGAKFSWRALIVGGEALTWDLTELATKLSPDCTIINEYGPTETTVGVISSSCGLGKERFNTSEMPIGYPRLGGSAYVLDQSLRPVPAWIAGDLYIGGNCVGRGYIQSSDLTAERFLPDPFREVQGGRMYATGDRARYRSDGTLEFLGRHDGQIKLHGYRIELSEIEATLCRHPHVQAAIAMVIPNKSGGKLLAAWAAVGQARIASQELRQFASDSLPSYMVPSVFTCVDRFTLTANGKVDRQKLPPAAEPSGTAGAPLDDVEESLLAVWQKVLGKEIVSVDDNYFALGGDSLRVVQVVHESRRYGITIRAMDILRYQTIRNLRKALRQERRYTLFPNGIPEASLPAPEGISPILPDIVDFYPVSGIQRFVLETYAKNRDLEGIYHIQECFHLEDPALSIEALKLAFEAVVQRHPALRTVFYLTSHPPVQCVRKTVSWNLVVKDISHLDDSEQETNIGEEIDADRRNLFDTANIHAPLFRVTIFLRSATQFSLLFVCHHAIMDGWGHQVLLNHLVEAYTKIKHGKISDLGEPDNTYHQFVTYEEAMRSSEQVSQFWRSYLSGISFPSLPDFVPPGAQEKEDPIVVAEFSSEQNAVWESVARENAVSMQALLLAVWLEVLRDWSGEPLVSTGVISNGRSEYLTDPLSAVGLFWNVVPIFSRTKLPLLQQAAVVQQDLVDIQPYASYPLPQLIAENGGQQPFYSVFRYLNFWNMKQIPEESGLRLQGTYFVDRYPFALTFTSGVSAIGRYIQIEYNPKSMSRECVKGLLGSYQALLDELTQAGITPREATVAAS